jgi:integrase
MRAQGRPLHVVSETLGHAGITITKDVYGHLGDQTGDDDVHEPGLFGS